MGALMGGQLCARRGRHQRPLCPARNAPEHSLRYRFVEQHHGEDQGILRRPAADRGLHGRRIRQSRSIPFLHLLGGDAHPHVHPDRRLGRGEQGVRGNKVLSLYPRGKRADARRHHGPLHPYGQELRHRHDDDDDLYLSPAVHALLGLFRRLCREGPDVAPAHMAA